MAAEHTKAAVAEEAKLMLARVDKGQASLQQLSLSYPGGDVCPAMVVRGLSGLLAALTTFEATTDGEWSPDEQAALTWLRLWVDAGASFLPKGER